VDGVLAITGPPGSGKTLVLCARANRLAEQHPDWDIRVLCYNRVLVPYLRTLTSAHPNIRVNTVGNFSASLGVRISLNDPDRAWRDYEAAVRKGLVPTIDAVLIDEWQDFYPAWTALAECVLRPGRGGMVAAGDANQALYHDIGMEKPVSLPVETLTLGRPYRSTRQILDVTSALGNQLEVDGRDHAFEGEPVDLVWATKGGDQAAAVARDVILLLQAGSRLPQDIGILATRKWAMGGIARALEEADVPCRVVYPSQAKDLDLTEPTVKILTVHSAKGLEFDVVFLVGLEYLPDPDGTDDVDRQGRTGYVGATRARDQLVLCYTKDNTYLERIRALPEITLRRWVWPDDYPEA
jgi:superfamily I DNA/RNA helicase